MDDESQILLDTDMETAAELIRLEKRLLDPAIRKTPKTVGALLADGFIEFGSSGQVYRKEDVLRSLVEEREIRFEPDGFKAVELAPGVVLVIFQLRSTDLESGEAIASMRSSIWQQLDGRWQMVFHQGTRIPGCS